MNSRKRTKNRRGFTLVEVLASLAIFAIIVPFAMRGATLSANAASVARHRAEAATLGEAKLTDMVIEGTWATEGTQGTFAPDYPNYRWSLQNAQRDPNLTELMLTVTWPEHGQDRSLNMSTMVYAGAAAGGAGTGTGTGGTP